MTASLARATMKSGDLPGNEAMREFLDELSASTQISKYIELPMIAVMGDTSSGKSSLLSNISMVELPSSNSLTTRCPIMLQMRRSTVREARVNVQWKSAPQPKSNSDINEPPAWPEFEERVASDATWHSIPRFVQEAQEHILFHTGKDVAPDIVSLKISGPDGVSPEHPLTLIDLPGLVRSRGQDDAETLVPDIEKLVEEYLQNPRCVILAVVPANVDFHNSQIMAQAKQVDPNTSRTIPVITKPDLIDKGAENDVLALLLGNKISFDYGFHMIKGRGQASLDRSDSIAKGLLEEQIFFTETIPWKTVEDRTLFGTDILRRKLGEVMMKQIKQTVPTILGEIRQKQQSAQSQLSVMGSKAHLTVADKRRYYQEICNSFVSQLKASLSGKGRATQNKDVASAAARLHEACAEFMNEIRAGSLGTIKTIVEGAHVLVTTPKGDVRGEVVHLDKDFACVDYIDEMDENVDVLFDVRGLKAQQELDEDEVWSDGNKVFIARKNSVCDTLRQIKLGLVRTDPSWLIDKIAENRTDDLACFLNVDIFKNIVESFIDDDWKPQCNKLLDRTHNILLSTITEAIELKLAASTERYPPLRLFFEKQCRAVAEELIREAQKQIHKHLEIEKHPYTQDHLLFENIAQTRNRGLKRQLEAALKLDQEGVYDTQAIKAIMDGVFERHGQKSVDEHMAEEMEIVLEAYGQVATKRVIDRTPMVCWEIFRSLSLSIQESLWNVTDDTLNKCMQESSEFAKTYQSLTEMLEEMNKALEIFETVF